MSEKNTKVISSAIETEIFNNLRVISDNYEDNESKRKIRRHELDYNSEVKYASGWMHPDDVDELQKQNQALLEASKESHELFNYIHECQTLGCAVRVDFNADLDAIIEKLDGIIALEDM